MNSSSFSQGLAATRHQYNRHGLEIALPYYDRRLVEFIMAVPAYILGRPGYSRLLQRQSMIGYLPEFVWQRQNRTSFVPLMQKGLQDKERETVKGILVQTTDCGEAVCEWRLVARAELQKPFEFSPEATFLWNCIALELWLKCFWS